MKTTHGVAVRGSTFTNILITVLTVVVLGMVVLPYLLKAKRTPKAIWCFRNLGEIGLAARIYASDHDGQFPWHISTNSGGTLEHTDIRNVPLHWAMLSNEIQSPKILKCPNDVRALASEFVNSASNISYFVGLDSREGRNSMFLSGDRSITTNGQFLSGLLRVEASTRVSWTPGGLHGGFGYVGLADGSVQQTTSTSLTRMAQDGDPPFRLLIP